MNCLFLITTSIKWALPIHCIPWINVRTWVWGRHGLKLRVVETNASHCVSFRVFWTCLISHYCKQINYNFAMLFWEKVSTMILPTVDGTVISPLLSLYRVGGAPNQLSTMTSITHYYCVFCFVDNSVYDV